MIRGFYIFNFHDVRASDDTRSSGPLGFDRAF